MCVAFLGLQVLLDRHLAADRCRRDDFPVLSLEDGEHPALGRQPGDLQGVARRRPPAQRARHEDMQVSRPAQLHGTRHLRLQITDISHGRRCHIRDLVRHCQTRHVLALAERAAWLGPHSLGRHGACGRRGGPRPLHAGVHVGLVVVADVEHVIVALEHAGQGPEADIHGGAIPALAHDPDIGAALGLHGRCHTSGHGRGVPEQRVQPGDPPGGLGVRGGEHLKTPGGIDRHELPVGCPHRGIEGDAGTECLSAPRAGAVA